MHLRPYKSCDAETIAGWLRAEEIFLKWGGQHIGPYPLSAGQINRKYTEENGGCAEADNFYPWVAFTEEDGVVGHFIMRYLHGNHKILRFGWVIVDDTIRGKGIGTKMLKTGLRFAFDILGAEKVTLGVFTGNEIAHRCYLKAGFRDAEVVSAQPWDIIEMEISKADWQMT